MKKSIGIFSVVIGAFGYAYMVALTMTGTCEGLSFTTFALWAALAWISGFSMLKQGANPAIPMVYGVGATSVALILLIKGKYLWTGLDTTIAVMVAICVVLWKTRGARWALILSVVAAVIAGVPFIMMTWRAPSLSPIISNSAFLLANFLSFVSAKKWTLQDRLYSGVNVGVCLALVIPWLIN